MDGWLVSSPQIKFFSVDVDNNDNNNNANNCPPDLTKLPNYKKKENPPPHPHSPARIPQGQDPLLLPANVAVALENCGTRERERERASSYGALIMRSHASYYSSYRSWIFSSGASKEEAVALCLSSGSCNSWLEIFRGQQ
jgi:hypothetical protein